VENSLDWNLRRIKKAVSIMQMVIKLLKLVNGLTMTHIVKRTIFLLLKCGHWVLKRT
jgi:hypothetical protein